MPDGDIRRRAYRRLRRLVLGSYYRLVALNYRTECLAPRKRTVAGPVRSYELYNRHGRDRMLAALERRCSSEAVVYDVGANVGTYTIGLLAGEPDRRIVAFEPAPIAARKLRKNVELNGFETRVDLRKTGLGDDSGHRPFYVSSYTELSGFDRESATRWEASITDVVSAPIERLDTVAASSPPPDVIKIDVEGAAPAVLRGGRETLSNRRPAVFLETHADGLAGEEPSECRTLLTELGYEIDDRDGYWWCEPSAERDQQDSESCQRL